MKNNKFMIIIAIILLVIVIVCLMSFMVRALNGNFKFGFAFSNRPSKELVVDTTYDEFIDTLAINVKSGDIEIREAMDEQIHLTIYADKEYTSYDVQNGTLKIDASTKPCFGICFGNDSARVIVHAPKDFSGNIKLTDDYGDIDIENFKDSNMSISSSAGDVKVGSVKDANIKNKYGDITLNEAESATITADCGDVNLGYIGTAKIQNHYGDINIKQILSHMDISADCGDIKVNDVVLTKNSKIKNSYGDISIGSTNEIYIDAKTSLGDISVKNNYRTSDIELKIENSCGDIAVRN